MFTTKTMKLMGVKAQGSLERESKIALSRLEHVLAQAERLEKDVTTWSEAAEMTGRVSEGGVVDQLDELMIDIGETKLGDRQLYNLVVKAKRLLSEFYLIAIEYALHGFDDKGGKKYQYPRDLDRSHIRPALEVLEEAVDNLDGFIESTF